MPSPQQFTLEQVQRMMSGASHAELAREFGCSDMPIRRWRIQNGWERPTTLTAVEAAPKIGPSDEDVLREQNRHLKAQLRRTDRASVGDERVLRAIEAAINGVEPVRLPPMLRDASAESSGTEAPHHRQVGVWSDWHYGETVSKAQMNGLNEFNTTIAEDRVSQLVASLLKFKRVRPAATGLDLWVLGDMASGSIHALEETNEIPAAEQYVRVGYLMADAIRRLAPHYPDISCAGIVGNHPRPGKEPASKDAYNNGDWIAYKVAEAATRDLSNVTWEIPPGGMLVRRAAGLTFLLWHGDGVRSSMPGVPWGGIARRVNVLKDTYAAMGTRIDYVVVGHFHQLCVVEGVFMNGSLVGPNEYGMKNFGGGQLPKQMLLNFDEKRSRLTDISVCELK